MLVGFSHYWKKSRVIIRRGKVQKVFSLITGCFPENQGVIE